MISPRNLSPDFLQASFYIRLHSPSFLLWRTPSGNFHLLLSVSYPFLLFFLYLPPSPPPHWTIASSCSFFSMVQSKQVNLSVLASRGISQIYPLSPGPAQEKRPKSRQPPRVCCRLENPAQLLPPHIFSFPVLCVWFPHHLLSCPRCLLSEFRGPRTAPAFSKAPACLLD